MTLRRGADGTLTHHRARSFKIARKINKERAIKKLRGVQEPLQRRVSDQNIDNAKVSVRRIIAAIAFVWLLIALLALAGCASAPHITPKWAAERYGYNQVTGDNYSEYVKRRDRCIFPN